MNVLQRRLLKLEAGKYSGDKQIKVLIQQEGESREDCLKRHGYRPDERWLPHRLLVMEQGDIDL